MPKTPASDNPSVDNVDVPNAVSEQSNTSQAEEKKLNGDGRSTEVQHPDRTRYGDWEKAGRCIDF